MAPVQVTNRNKGEVFVNLYGGGKKGFELGEPVRMGLRTRVFKKGYTPNWSQEIVFIKSKNRKHKIPTYVVRDYNNDDILGTWYEQELQSVVPPKVYKVERVLKTRKRGGRTEYYVKWEGYSDRFNSWVTDIEDI